MYDGDRVVFDHVPVNPDGSTDLLSTDHEFLFTSYVLYDDDGNELAGQRFRTPSLYRPQDAPLQMRNLLSFTISPLAD